MLNCLKVPVSVVTGTPEQGTWTPCIWAGAGELRQLGPVTLTVAGEGRQCAPAWLLPAGLSVICW